MSGLSIMHVEDEFDELTYLVNIVKTALEDLIDEAGYDVGAGVMVKQLASSDDMPVSWVVYELRMTAFPRILIHYVFVRPFEVPPAAKAYLRESRAFILDVLRMDPTDPGSTKLENFLEEALQSLSDSIRPTDRLAYFTAYQGAIVQNPAAMDVSRVRKGSNGEIQRFLATSISEWLIHDKVLT